MGEKNEAQRPRGLKRSRNVREEESADSLQKESKTGEDQPELATEVVEIANEVEDSTEDGLALYVSGMSEAVRGNTDMAVKLLQATVHLLQGELANQKSLPPDRRHLLGNCWVQTGVLIRDWEHVEVGVGHLRLAKTDQSESPDLLVDTALAVLSMYQLQHDNYDSDSQTDDREGRKVPDKEKDDVKEALAMLDKAVELRTQTVDQKELREALIGQASAIHQYAMTLPDEDLRCLLMCAVKKYKAARDIANSADVNLSLAHSLVDAAETRREMPNQEREDTIDLLTNAREAAEAALRLADEEELDDREKAEALQLLSGILMHLGDVISVAEEDDVGAAQSETERETEGEKGLDSMSLYKLAQKHIVHAHQLAPDFIPLQLVQEVEAVCSDI